MNTARKRRSKYGTIAPSFQVLKSPNAPYKTSSSRLNTFLAPRIWLCPCIKPSLSFVFYYDYSRTSVSGTIAGLKKTEKIKFEQFKSELTIVRIYTIIKLNTDAVKIIKNQFFVFTVRKLFNYKQKLSISKTLYR